MKISRYRERQDFVLRESSVNRVTPQEVEGVKVLDGEELYSFKLRMQLEKQYLSKKLQN